MFNYLTLLSGTSLKNVVLRLHPQWVGRYVGTLQHGMLVLTLKVEIKNEIHFNIVVKSVKTWVGDFLMSRSLGCKSTFFKYGLTELLYIYI